uniref:Focal AT domain-containing protein n=1 Tax=Callorhinchus milii TaxID=7868 RepID=A0A4W3HBF0_CALMI
PPHTLTPSPPHTLTPSHTHSVTHPLTTLLTPSLKHSHLTQIQGTVKLLNKDLSELINKLRLTQQNVVTSLSDECKRLMLAAAHTLAVDSKNLLDAVDQARLKAGEARTLPD